MQTPPPIFINQPLCVPLYCDQVRARTSNQSCPFTREPTFWRVLALTSLTVNIEVHRLRLWLKRQRLDLRSWPSTSRFMSPPLCHYRENKLSIYHVLTRHVLTSFRTKWNSIFLYLKCSSMSHHRREIWSKRLSDDTQPTKWRPQLIVLWVLFAFCLIN